jgi:hypothetical protein
MTENQSSEEPEWEFGSGTKQDKSSKFKEFFKGAFKSAGAAAKRQAKNLFVGNARSPEEKYQDIVTKAMPYIDEGIEAQVQQRHPPRLDIPANATAEQTEKLIKQHKIAMKAYEGRQNAERDRLKRQFTSKSLLSQAESASEKLKKVRSKQASVSKFMQEQQVLQKIAEQKHNPISRILSGIQQTQTESDLYRRASPAPLNQAFNALQTSARSGRAPRTPEMGNNPMQEQNLWQATPMQPLQPTPNTTADIPNRRMMPPAYSASHPWMAPQEYPPFGDVPVRNFAEKNLDHPLFQTNKPKNNNNQNFMW